MYINLTFIEYMSAVCTGIISIAILISVFVMRAESRTKQLKKLLLFSVISFLFLTLYFIFYYREKVFGLYELDLPWRIIDYLLEGSLYFALVLLICSLGDPLDQIKSNKLMVKVTGIVCGTWVVFGWIMTWTYMDAYYHISDQSKVSALTITEMIIIGMIAIIIIVCAIMNMRIVSLSLTGKYIAVLSLLMLILLLGQSFVNYHLYLGHYNESAWDFETPDTKGMIFALINIATIFFILKTDFTPIYISKTPLTEASVINTKEQGAGYLLDVTAEKHRLTSREREILELVYNGYSNPDIAKQLYISNNTVKRHMKHIFEKLDVSTRIEMIHLINSQKIPR